MKKVKARDIIKGWPKGKSTVSAIDPRRNRIADLRYESLDLQISKIQWFFQGVRPDLPWWWPASVPPFGQLPEIAGVRPSLPSQPSQETP